MNFLGFSLRNNLFVAPMAGVTDRPFRQLCKRLGAAYAVSEMVTSNSLLYGSNKTLRRADHTGESEPIAVQIAGADPVMMANAARLNVERGAQVIDINMGCPAKKICNAMAGSALLKNEALVERILTAVVAAVPDTPVTLKIRTGWDQHNINAGNILGIAESAGIRALTVHGRTRSQQYSGQAEYDTIKRLKAAARIPIIANGDIDSPQKARQVLDYTGVDAIMIGRAAQGKPWLFREIEHYLTTGEYLPAPKVGEIHHLLRTHLDELYHFYGRETGAKIARKHISWYTKGMTNSADFRRFVNRLATENEQIAAIDGFFKTFAAENEDLGYKSKEEAAL